MIQQIIPHKIINVMKIHKNGVISSFNVVTKMYKFYKKIILIMTITRILHNYGSVVDIKYPE